ENPCVPGSIPGGTTIKPELFVRVFYFYLFLFGESKKGYIFASAKRKQAWCLSSVGRAKD
ncbi:hypothetical protein, partial [Tenacibaculum maritimum]|uniref:hypothetical protein n=1 Tax=Tenacibaculum maritimum TaxID=107401 RepID=UPI003877739B